MKTLKNILPEPELDYKLPSVHKRPRLENLRKYKIENIDGKIIQVRRQFYSGNTKKFSYFYDQLISEYQPLLNWAISCWEYILTKKGVRFL